MRNGRNKERRNISLTPELDEYISAEAERGNRPYSRQVEMMLKRAMEVMTVDTNGTQVSMPTNAEEREMLMERIR